MNDLISRQAAIEALGERPIVWDEWTDEWTLGQRKQYDIDKLAIETVPSAQIDQLWIPVSERHPGECQTVIASVDTHIYEEARFVDGRWWWAYEARTDYWEEIKKDVTAWMPLPEPYRKGANPP